MVFQDYELIPTKRVIRQRNSGFLSIFYNRLFLSTGGYSTLYLGGVATYAYILHLQLKGVTGNALNKYMMAAPAFLGGFVAGIYLFGNSQEFFHLMRNYGTYRKEFKEIKNELYYS